MKYKKPSNNFDTKASMFEIGTLQGLAVISNSEVLAKISYIDC